MKITTKTLGEFVAELQKYDQSLPMVENRFTITIAKYHFDNQGNCSGYHYGDGYGCCTINKQLGQHKLAEAIRIE